MTSVAPRFGVLLLQNAPVTVLIDRARRAERMGFDQVWIGDHFVNPYAPGQDWFDGWSVLAALAVSTSRVRLGPLVSSVTLHNPAHLARMAMTVDHLSGGRLELGLGPAGAPLDYQMTGLPTWAPGERVERLEETLQIVEALLEHGAVDFDGARYQIHGAVLAPRPVQQPRPPITVGALGPRAIAIAARLADSWNTYGVAVGRDARGALDHAGALEATRRRVATLVEACVAAGRDPVSIRRSYLSFQGIMEPILEPEAFVDFARDFQDVGIGELVVYWPDGDAAERRLEAVVERAFPILRA